MYYELGFLELELKTYGNKSNWCKYLRDWKYSAD